MYSGFPSGIALIPSWSTACIGHSCVVPYRSRWQSHHRVASAACRTCRPIKSRVSLCVIHEQGCTDGAVCNEPGLLPWVVITYREPIRLTQRQPPLLLTSQCVGRRLDLLCDRCAGGMPSPAAESTARSGCGTSSRDVPGGAVSTDTAAPVNWGEAIAGYVQKDSSKQFGPGLSGRWRCDKTRRSISYLEDK
jgi:hypothetical protein